METSKVVPPPLGEPPPRLTPPTLRNAGLHIAGQPRSKAEVLPERVKKKPPASTLRASGLQKRLEDRDFEMVFTESNTILGLAVEQHDESWGGGGPLMSLFLSVI